MVRSGSRFFRIQKSTHLRKQNGLEFRTLVGVNLFRYPKAANNLGDQLVSHGNCSMIFQGKRFDPFCIIIPNDQDIFITIVGRAKRSENIKGDNLKIEIIERSKAPINDKDSLLCA